MTIFFKVVAMAPADSVGTQTQVAPFLKNVVAYVSQLNLKSRDHILLNPAKLIVGFFLQSDLDPIIKADQERLSLVVNKYELPAFVSRLATEWLDHVINDTPNYIFTRFPKKVFIKIIELLTENKLEEAKQLFQNLGIPPIVLSAEKRSAFGEDWANLYGTDLPEHLRPQSEVPQAKRSKPDPEVSFAQPTRPSHVSSAPAPAPASMSFHGIPRTASFDAILNSLKQS